jgi:hypothetical protein
MDGLHAELEEAGMEHVMTGIPGMFTFVLGIKAAGPTTAT